LAVHLDVGHNLFPGTRRIRDVEGGYADIGDRVAHGFELYLQRQGF
jgi:hypothetical protein